MPLEAPVISAVFALGPVFICNSMSVLTRRVPRSFATARIARRFGDTFFAAAGRRANAGDDRQLLRANFSSGEDANRPYRRQRIPRGARGATFAGVLQS